MKSSLRCTTRVWGRRTRPHWGRQPPGIGQGARDTATLPTPPSPTSPQDPEALDRELYQMCTAGFSQKIWQLGGQRQPHGQRRLHGHVSRVAESGTARSTYFWIKIPLVHVAALPLSLSSYTRWQGSASGPFPSDASPRGRQLCKLWLRGQPGRTTSPGGCHLPGHPAAPAATPRAGTRAEPRLSNATGKT